MTLVLDSGALIALEKGNKTMWDRYRLAMMNGVTPKTHAGVLGQVWRDGSKQARLALALGGITVRSLDERLGRAAGRILAVSGESDVIDAALVLLAEDGDDIITSDREDIAQLVAATGRHVEVIPV